MGGAWGALGRDLPGGTVSVCPASESMVPRRPPGAYRKAGGISQCLQLQRELAAGDTD